MASRLTMLRLQIGQHATTAFNYFLTQPDTPDGTLEIRQGNADGTGTVTGRLDNNGLIPTAAQNTTSGSAVNFSNVPAWVKRITLSISTFSTNGSGIPQVQLGDSTGFKTSGYNGAVGFTNAAASVGGSNISTGFALYPVATGTGVVWSGMMEFVKLDSTTWVSKTALSLVGNPVIVYGSGDVTLSGPLTQFRLIAGGSDTLDLGKVSAIYE